MILQDGAYKVQKKKITKKKDTKLEFIIERKAM